jgi:hypothetical protein
MDIEMDLGFNSSQLGVEEPPSFSDEIEQSSPRKRARRRVAASVVHPGQRDNPQSAYHGSPAHNRASTAKHETQVHSEFLVSECEAIG